MTTSGIGISDALEKAFENARMGGGVRFLELDIEEESLTVVHTQKLGNGSAEAEYKEVISRLLPKQPRIFLYRLDDKGDLGFHWAFLSYVPDGSPVRKRMLFASSREACRKQLGSAYFTVDLNGSAPDEFSWESLVAASSQRRQQQHHDDADSSSSGASGASSSFLDVRTETEKALARQSQQEVDMGGANAHAVRFPASPELEAALKKLSAQKNLGSVVSMRLDTEKETIVLDTVQDLAQNSNGEQIVKILRSLVAEKEPRFFLARIWFEQKLFTTDADQDSNDAAAASDDASRDGWKNVFFYCCPEECNVRSKMTYSTVKSVAVDTCARSMQAAVDAKLETTGQEDDLTVASIREAVAPAEQEKKQTLAIARPTKPKVSRPRKLVK